MHLSVSTSCVHNAKRSKPVGMSPDLPFEATVASQRVASTAVSVTVSNRPQVCNTVFARHILLRGIAIVQVLLPCYSFLDGVDTHASLLDLSCHAIFSLSLRCRTTFHNRRLISFIFSCLIPSPDAICCCANQQCQSLIESYCTKGLSLRV